MRRTDPRSASRSCRLSLRITLASGGIVGPGKRDLLEAIARYGSISAAARSMNMSYRRAWDLVEDITRAVGSTVVSTSAGGAGGGGARLTPSGEALLDIVHAIEAAAEAAAKPDLDRLDALSWSGR